jgi:hypothetical protein
LTNQGAISMQLTIVRMPLAIVVASLLLFACGGEETGDRSKAATDAVTAADPVPGQAYGQAPGHAQELKKVMPRGLSQVESAVAPDGESVSLKGADEAGKPFNVEVGKSIKIPKDFPTDVPIVPDARPMATMSAAGHGTFISFKTSESQAAIYEFYLSQLPEKGWKVRSENSFGGQLKIEFAKDVRTTTVIVGGTEGDTRVSIVVQEKD